MDDKISIIKSAYGIIPPDAMTVNEMLYHQCEYIKKNAVKGDTGDAATIKVGTTKTLPPGSEASVSNSGDEHNAVFNFALPHGDKGETGATFTPEVSPEGDISWTNDKGLPNPEPANIRGQKGDTGEAATVQVGKVTTLPAGSQATIENVGDEHNAVFDFALPQGAEGEGVLNATEISLESTKDINEIYSTIKTLSETQKIVNVLNGRYSEGGAKITAVKDGVTKTYTMFAPLLSWSNRGELEITGILVEGSEGSGTPTGIFNQATLVYYSTGNPMLIRSGISFEDYMNDMSSEISATMLSTNYPIVVYSQEV